MKEIKLSAKNRIKVLQKAMDVLESGGVIIYPTETSYGLGASFYNQSAIDKIYRIKGRDKKKPLPIIVSSIISATTLVEFSQPALKLAEDYWPGPLTLALPYRYCNLRECVDDYLALRVSSHPLVKELVENFGQPLISTSANIADENNCYVVKDVREQFKDLKEQPDLFINAGDLPRFRPSTIIKVSKDGKMKILRQGDLKIKI